jgi:hypothetical protein
MKKITFCALAMLGFGFTATAQTSVSASTSGDFPVEVFSQRGESQAACSQEEVSNNFENGFGNTNNGVTVADDIVVPDGEMFTLESVTFNMINDGGYNDVIVQVYADNGGLPGAQISSETVVPDSQDQIGIAFGREVREVVVELDDEVVLEGVDGSDTTYWIAITTPNPVDTASDSFWETQTISMNVNLVSFSLDDGAFWENVSGGNPTPPAAVFLAEGDCDTLGLEDSLIAGLSVYPNPTQGQVTIDTKGQFQLDSVVVYDILGKRSNVSLNGDTVDMSALSAGLYIIEVTAEGGETATYKIVKQ